MPLFGHHARVRESVPVNSANHANNFEGLFFSQDENFGRKKRPLFPVSIEKQRPLGAAKTCLVGYG